MSFDFSLGKKVSYSFETTDSTLLSKLWGNIFLFSEPETSLNTEAYQTRIGNSFDVAIIRLLMVTPSKIQIVKKKFNVSDRSSYRSLLRLIV